jgi:uncharacterized protein (TIGR02118 family)
MTTITVCYKHGVPFDDGYYFTKHIPLVEKLRAHGLRNAEVRKISTALDGTRAPYQLIATLYFDNSAAMDVAMSSPEGKTVVEDIPNFYGGAPDAMIGEVA